MEMLLSKKGRKQKLWITFLRRHYPDQVHGYYLSEAAKAVKHPGDAVRLYWRMPQMYSAKCKIL